MAVILVRWVRTLIVRRMLCVDDGEEISRGVAEALDYWAVGERVGPDPAVVSRDVRRHGRREGCLSQLAERAAVAARGRR